MKLKSIYSALVICTLAVSFVSCKNTKNNASQEQQAESEVATAMQVDDVLAKADSLVGKTIDFEGICTHTCQHGGKKMFLMGSDDSKTLRVDASEEIGSFPAEVVNNIVEVKGVLVEERIDYATVAKMEEAYKQSTEASHGQTKEVGCETENSAHGQKGINSFELRMKNYKDRIAERKEKEGKEYLSFYAVKGISYNVKK